MPLGCIRRFRLQAAISANERAREDDLVLPMEVRGDWVVMYKDWRGGLTSEEIENLAQSAIHNVAHLHDHLKKWARQNRATESIIDAAVPALEALKIVRDLSNNDKHGYPPRDGGFSKRSPRLRDVTRALKLEGGSSISVSLATGEDVLTWGDLALCLKGRRRTGDGARSQQRS
jgi:hypothetical protein